MVIKLRKDPGGLRRSALTNIADEKYNELFGIVHEKWHDTCETKISNI